MGAEPATEGNGARRGPWLALGLLLALAALWRVPHLTGPIDDPHSWRQAETASIARAFHADGIDLMRPSVVWLGPHQALAFEFPLPEALMALAYHVTGGESLPAARVLALLAFLGAAAYLFALLRRLFDASTALLAVAFFCAVPLGQYYSRAVHIDPFVLCAAGGWLYHAMRGYDEESVQHALIAGAWALVGFLIKAPYLFFLALPVGLWMLGRFDLRSALVLVLSGLPAIGALLVWRLHAHALALAVPDLGFVPGFSEHFGKHLGASASWYFGSWTQLEDAGNWSLVLTSVLTGLTGRVGLAFLALALAASPLVVRSFGARRSIFLAGWVVGALAYVLIFFNLSVRHDYYQLPLLAPFAALCAVGLEAIRRALPARFATLGKLAVVGALLLFALESTILAHRRFYQLDTLRLEAGRIADANTPRDALLIVGIDDGTQQNDDPRLLYLSHRDGWPVPPAAIDPGVAERLQRLGATHVFVLVDGAPLPGLQRLTARHPSREIALAEAPWRALLVDLRAVQLRGAAVDDRE